MGNKAIVVKTIKKAAELRETDLTIYRVALTFCYKLWERANASHLWFLDHTEYLVEIKHFVTKVETAVVVVLILVNRLLKFESID